MITWKTSVIALVACIIGLFLGRLSSPSIEKKAPVAPALSASSTTHSTHASQKSLSPLKKDRVFSALFKDISGTDFESLAKSAEFSKNELDNSALLQVLITEWARTEPLQALAFANDLNRSDLVYLGLRQMSENDPDGALTWMDQNVRDLTMRGHFLTGVYQGIAARDPADAIARISELPSGQQRDQILSLTIDEWAKEDVNAVFSWLETAEFSQQTPYLYDQVVSRYILRSPLEASALVSEMESGASKSNFASSVAFELAELDKDKALAWTKSLSGEEREFAMEGLLEKWASKENGIEALDFVLEQKDSSNYENLYSKVVMKLSQTSSAELEQRLSSLEENEQVLAAEQLAQVYSSNQPEKAHQWLDTLESGSVKDAALKSALGSFIYTDINSAFTLSETISSEETRLQEMQQVMLEWIRVDQATAEEALSNTTTIPENQKEIILKWVYHKVKPRSQYLIPEKN